MKGKLCFLALEIAIAHFRPLLHTASHADKVGDKWKVVLSEVIEQISTGDGKRLTPQQESIDFLTA